LTETRQKRDLEQPLDYCLTNEIEKLTHHYRHD